MPLFAACKILVKKFVFDNVIANGKLKLKNLRRLHRVSIEQRGKILDKQDNRKQKRDNRPLN